MVQRTLILAFLAMMAGMGCNAGTSGGQVRSKPAPVTREALKATQIIAQINKNAEAVQALQAESSIQASDGSKTHPLKGKLRLEREKDFRLVLTPPMSSKTVADIGSNEKGFWFWVYPESKKDNTIYVCDYDRVGSSRLSITMQPDWIMEAMGLRVITPREAATIDARPGEVAGQLLLTQLRKEPNGVTYTKETVVNESTGAIIEHRLYAGAKKDLLARATIKKDRTIAIKPTGESQEITVRIPERFTLDWITEKFKLDITMAEPTVNPSFTKEMASNLFNEPEIPGATRYDLAAVNQGPANASSFIHESMPRSGIRLGQPEAVPSDDMSSSSANTRSSLSRGRLNGLPELPPDSDVIGPQIPQGSATDPAAVQASTRGAWRPIYEN